jgi:hypothetical protein
MLEAASSAAQSSNFNLKNEVVELVRPTHSERTFMTIGDLEAIR